MTGIDTNILIYARGAGSPWQKEAVAFLEGLAGDPDVVVAELVLVEYYLALRNPAVFSPVLGAKEAAAECRIFQRHPSWALAEQANVMDRVWQEAAKAGCSRRRIIDIRWAFTLQAHGVIQFATASTKDFAGLGFERVWNPLGPLPGAES